MTGRRKPRGSFSPDILEAFSDLEEEAARRAKKLEVSVAEEGLEQSWEWFSSMKKKKLRFGMTNKPGHSTDFTHTYAQESDNKQSLLQVTAFPNGPFHIPPIPTQPLLKGIKESQA